MLIFNNMVHGTLTVEKKKFFYGILMLKETSISHEKHFTIPLQVSWNT